MNFQHYDLGHCDSGDTYAVSLQGDAPNVRLMDDTNFRSYRRSGACDFIGGVAQRTRVVLQVPRSGHWHIVVDFRGLRGSVRTALTAI